MNGKVNKQVVSIRNALFQTHFLQHHLRSNMGSVIKDDARLLYICIIIYVPA